MTAPTTEDDPALSLFLFPGVGTVLKKYDRTGQCVGWWAQTPDGTTLRDTLGETLVCPTVASAKAELDRKAVLQPQPEIEPFSPPTDEDDDAPVVIGTQFTD